MKWKALTTATLAMGMTLSLAGLAMAEEEKPYVIWVNPLVGSPVFTSADEGITAASEEFGFDLKIIGPSVLDDTQMYQALQSALVEKPDLIVTTPYNYTALAPLYVQAQEEGIPIIDISSDSGEESGRISFIGTDNTAYGQLAADYINEEKGGEAHVMTMMANLDTSNQLEQRLAFEEKCAEEYPGIETVLVDEDNGDSTQALQKFEDALKAHPEIDTIFSLESIGGVAAANAVEELGLEGKVTILAIDDNADTIQYVKDGKIWATMAQNFSATDSWTIALFTLVHSCPQLFIFSPARKRAAAGSSASAMTTAGAFPPSSREWDLILLLEAATTCRPVWVEPIKVIILGMGLSLSVVPTSSTVPLTMLTTPVGNPISWASWPIRSADSGVREAGLITQVQPEARAGPNFAPRFSRGIFQARWLTTTPRG